MLMSYMMFRYVFKASRYKMSLKYDFISTGVGAKSNVKRHSELDLVPTRITSIEPDPLLFVTPEKKSLLKNFQKGDSLLSHKSPSIIPPDPDLFVTPEKFPSVLKNDQRISVIGPTKSKVRFNIPESSDDNTASSLSANTQSTYNESSTLSTEFDEGSSQTTEDTSDFATKAALYTQRNPLADITIESHTNFDSTTSSDTFSSTTNSSQRNIPKLFDKKDHKHTGTKKQGGGPLEEPSKSNNITKITSSKLKLGHRRNTPAQQKIDKLTSNQENASLDKQIADDNTCGEKLTYLRKKSGLQKHQHSIRYINKDKDEMPHNSLESPKYSSSLITGQKLQQIKEEKFDALRTVTKKMHCDSNVKDFIEAKAAAGTNIDPEEQLYTNLVGVDAAMHDATAGPEFRRVKRAHFVKHASVEEPNIMEAFPKDLIQEKVILDSRCFIFPESNLNQAPLRSVMSLYEHSLGWS